MLTYLHVKNLALIREEEIRFTPGLNILTGETGAGKSIILGALSMALGGKADKDALRDGAEEALVEAVFSVTTEEERAALEALDIDVYDDEVILTRKLSGSRAAARINGETVPAQKMRAAGDVFLDIYGQNDHQTLLKKAKHLELLDAYGKEEIAPKKAVVEECFHKYKTLKDEFENANLDEGERARELSYLTHEIDEIKGAKLRPGEDEELEAKFRLLQNSQKIAAALSESYGLTGEENAAGMIGRALQRLSGLSEFDEALGDLEKTLLDAESSLSDFNRGIADYLSGLTFDEVAFRETEQRLDLINTLKTKYGHTIEEVLSALEEKQARHKKLTAYDAYLAELQTKLAKAEETLKKESDVLSAVRQKLAEKLSKEMETALSDLNFLDVRFSMDFREAAFGTNGTDDAEFLIATNVGLPLRPLRETASGGELSRIMLALKTVIVSKEEKNTLIFDEIDAGISGRTAQAVSERLSMVSKDRQVICITHLPQIAAMADTHFLIEKAVVGNDTVSDIRPLSEEESIAELSRMLGGTEITQAVTDNASEMKALAKKRKEEL